MMEEFDYLISPCDDAADRAASVIMALYEENPEVYISPRGRVLTILGIADKVSVLKEVRSLDNEQAVIDYYIGGGLYGFIPAKVWVETYQSIANLKKLMIGR